MLLVGAGLLLRSFLKVLDVDLGFQPERAAAVTVDYEDAPALAKSNAPDAEQKFWRHEAHISSTLLERVSALPGVEAAGSSDFLPLAGTARGDCRFPRGKTAGGLHVSVPLVYVISPGYLRAMGTALRGRDFAWSDRRRAQNVVMIKGTRACRVCYWPNNDAVGQCPDEWQQRRGCMIGVLPRMCTPRASRARTAGRFTIRGRRRFGGTPQLVVRTTLPPAQLAASVMSLLRQANPKQSAAEFKPIEMLVDHANSPRRFFMMLVVVFAGLGVLLAALGIYGVISYGVTRQTQEIGIRMALGESRGECGGRCWDGLWG